MHMADALISPAVGATMWTASAAMIVYCSTRVRNERDERKTPLMGVLGAFLFAAQMINFTIPATGSSGHIGGGLLLAILLGPHAAFLTIASVLVVQALFFADGGLLALGCNIFNLGFFPAFVAYPLIHRAIAGVNPGRLRLSLATIIAAVAGLQMGALGVVLETVASGISSLPFSTFATLMLPIHLAIGLVEGIVTAAVVAFVASARPDILQNALQTRPLAQPPLRPLLLAFLVVAAVTGGVISWFASSQPDGLEWSIARVTGQEELNAPTTGLHGRVAALQERIALLPDYAFSGQDEPAAGHQETTSRRDERIGTSLSGIVGGLATLSLVAAIGLLLKRRPLPAR
jgi:cobalt/nickel transport system permease protein